MKRHRPRRNLYHVSVYSLPPARGHLTIDLQRHLRNQSPAVAPSARERCRTETRALSGIATHSNHRIGKCIFTVRIDEDSGIASYLGKGPRFTEAISQYARRYADQNDRDHAQLADAIALGKIESRPG